MSFEYFVGKRYLGAVRKEAFISLITFLSAAGVAVGVMVLIAVIAVMSGAEIDLRSRILGITSHIIVIRQGGGFSDYRNVVRNIEKQSGVDAAMPYIYTQGMLRSAKGMSPAVVRGVDSEKAEKIIRCLNKGDLKKMSAPSDISGIILGDELAKILNLKPGDIVSLITENAGSSSLNQMPQMNRFRVIGLFHSGIYDYDKSLSYIHIRDAQKILKVTDVVSGIDVRVRDQDMDHSGEIEDKIISELGTPYWASDWKKMNRNIFISLKLQKAVMFIILILIILVAAFNIAGALMMTVMEKTKDIGILKAMGATNRHIRRIFVFKGMMIGIFGTMLGIFGGVGICEILKHYKIVDLPPGVYFFDRLPVSLRLTDVIVIAISAIILCFLATIYPASRASKLDPVKAIRY